jgi:hypothetical protein
MPNSMALGIGPGSPRCWRGDRPRWRNRARQQDRENGLGHDGQGRALQRTRRARGVVAGWVKERAAKLCACESLSKLPRALRYLIKARGGPLPVVFEAHPGRVWGRPSRFIMTAETERLFVLSLSLTFGLSRGCDARAIAAFACGLDPSSPARRLMGRPKSTRNRVVWDLPAPK